MQIESHSFPNFGYLISKLPKEVLHELACKIDYLKANPLEFENYSDRLVATTDNAYNFIAYKSVLESYITKMITEYDNKFPGYLYSLDLVEKRTKIGITDLWVNLQGPNDINPNHNHPGIFSFVIWMYTPYYYHDQQKNLPGAKIKGAFEFSYTQTTGQINRIALPVDYDYNGKICLFPSSFTHCVYPYRGTDGDVRISISGNVKFLSNV